MSSLLERDYVRGPFSQRHPLDIANEEHVFVANRRELSRLPIWTDAFSHLRKDSRYYEIVEDTVCPEFRYSYFALRDGRGQVCAIQPFFTLDQDLFAGAGPRIKAAINRIRQFWPRFMLLKTLMVGCAAGEGHLQTRGETARRRGAALLASNIVRLARQEGASLIVLKEFPACYRGALSCFLSSGFARVPSMPMTRLDIAYRSFEEYMSNALGSSTRKGLRKKFRAAEEAAPIELQVVSGRIRMRG